MIGKAIRKGSTYLPIRNHAAALATLAPPKDYLGQAKAVFDDIVSRWRYVKDPVSRELLTFGPHELATLVLNLDGKGMGKGKGAGDCDCIAAATGALFESIGFKTRLAVTAPPGMRPGPMMAHVFIQVLIPNHGWTTVDPVVYPHHGFGFTPKHSRIAFYNLDGQLIGKAGNAVGLHGSDEKGVFDMYGQSPIPDLTQWQDYGMGGYDESGAEPEDWRLYGLPEFGAFSEKMGIMSCEGMGGLAVETTPQLYGGQLLARTPLLELAPEDYNYVNTMKTAYDGMMALGDDGAIYQYDGTLGFFKRLWKGIKKVGRKIRKKVRKVISKIPGGKYLIKLGKKVWKIAKKFVKPLAKFVGKYAAKLAPVAALIPGYGPAIAAGLYTAGKVAKLMTSVGAKIKKVGKMAKLVFPSGKSAKKFQKKLKRAAKKEARRQRRGGKIKRIGRRGRRRRSARASMMSARRRGGWGRRRSYRRRYGW